MTQWQAIGLGMGFIAVGFAVYEILVKTPLRHNGKAFGLVLFSFLVFMTWFATEVFSPRGAFIHVGALIGTIMAGNVFFGIMPSQRALVEAVQRGEAPDPKYGAFAKLRSTHNNYFTLPLLFIMISNHYPMTYSHELNWLVLSAMCFILAFARHFFNLRHRGEFKPSILVIAAIMMAGVAVWIAPKPVEVDETVAASLADGTFSDEDGMAIMEARCASCHAAAPTNPAFVSAPSGVLLETQAQVDVMKPKLIEVIQSNYMPLGNMTQMTDEERQQVIVWLAK
jgi:uncharacterized membrane protein